MKAHARAGALVLSIAAGAGACSAPGDRVNTAGDTAKTASVTARPIATSAPSVHAPDPHRHALGVAAEEALPVELSPMAGGARVLAIADEGERGAWARTIDGGGAMCRARWFEGAHVVTAFDGGDRTTFVTSDGDRLCVATFANDRDDPEARGCEAVRPEVVVPIGDRLAMLSLDIAVAAAKTPIARPASKPKTTSSGATKKSEKKKKGAAGSAAARAQGSGRATAPSGAAGAASKKKQKSARPASKGGVKKSRAEAIASAAAKAKVEVRVAWAGRDGTFEAASAPAGLGFERPLSGMMIADVAPRGSGADLVFYEAVAKPRKPSKTQLGSARLGIATIGADGKLVAGSRGTLNDDDLEYGYITGQNGPRLVSSPSATVLLTFAGRAGACQAERIFPTLGPAVLPKASCLLDPVGALLSPTPGAASPSLERLLATEPRRAPGQTRADGPLVAWAGDHAYFVGPSGFSTAPRDGDASGAAPPFLAKRSRIAWSAFAPDGEGIAFANGKLFRVDCAGAVSEIASAAAFDALGMLAAGVVQRAEGRADDTRRAARIGDGFWMARGDVIRLSPAPMKVAALAGRGVADASALVGGSDRGMLIDTASGALRVTFVATDGGVAAGPQIASPIRAGFDAVERAGGGAIVAGVSAADPTKVNAFMIDANGRSAAPRVTSMTMTAGAFGVRLVALPGGGALLMDRDRRRVVWLDDDAAERAAAPLPAEHAPASCIDGRPAPLAIPSMDPGKFVTVADLAEPGTCVRGELAWTANGGLRWFGTSVNGLDSIAEAGVLDGVASALPQAPRADSSASASATASAALTVSASASASTPIAAPPPPAMKVACPAEMVSIEGRFCVDRFESTLVDGKTGRALSPDFPGTPNLLEIVLGDWATERTHWGDVHARAFPLPEVPAWQRGARTEPIAVPLFGARPSGYVTGLVAEGACAAAGKRLCSLDEFTTACRGEDDRDFPYGDEYQDGVCNVYREEHPAALLHHNASYGHLDPRLNRVRAKGRPLFEITGARPACRSVWGSDAVYDLVGNLDEWVDEGTGAFAGGFYSRSTRAGCDSVITAHPKVYADYSTGVRCCKDSEK